MPVLLNVVWGLVLLLVMPVLLYRRAVHGKYRDGWSEKLWGRLPARDSDRPCLWFHAVSVGEVLQLQRLLDDPELVDGRDIVISTTTSTGRAVAREKFPQHTVCYLPLDFTWAVRNAIRRARPTALVLVELELWPNLILAAEAAGVPLMLVNGRISSRSFRGYRRIRPLMQRLLRCFSLLAVQNDSYAERLVALGAPADRVHVTGSIKFDHIATDRSHPRTQELRRFFGLRDSDRVLIAGSTQSPEEAYSLDIWQSLRPDFPDLRLILVPRHKERFDEVARLVTRRGLPLVRRSTGAVSQHSGGEPPVLLLDTLGELGACWGLADVAFVGGSLTRRGGQNMIEPAGYGAAVLFGPNTENFRDVSEPLLDGEAAVVVHSRQDYERVVRRLLSDPATAAELGRRAQTFVLNQCGGVRRTRDLMLPLLVEPRAADSGCAPRRAA